MAESGERRLRLAARWTLHCRSADRLVLVAEDDIRLIEDPLISEIVEALPDPESALSGRYPVEQIRAVVTRMRRDGLLAVPANLDRSAAAFWESLEAGPPAGPIAFQPLCAFGSEQIGQSLCASGLTVSTSAPRLLVTVDDYLDPALEPIDRDGRPWMLAKPVGHTIWLGPVFAPGTPCWECLAAAIRPHRWPQAAFTGWRGEAYPPQQSIAALPATMELAAGMIATAASVWVAKGEYPELAGAIVTFDCRTLRQSRHVVRGRRGCPRCDPAGRRSRVALSEFVSPITGVVSEIETTAVPQLGLMHAQSLFAAPLPERVMRGFPRLLRSAGKGDTREAAETVCIAEALERYSLIYPANETVVRGRAGEVAGLSPEDVLLFSQPQYRGREAWNRAQSGFQQVPEPFDPDEEIEWAEARSLVSGRKQMVPAGLCFMYYPFHGSRAFCSPDTNGCAAGQSLEEAQLRGLLELIERDAVALWWYNRVRRPGAPVGAFAGSRFRRLEAAFSAAGRSVVLLDIATDLGIPAYAAVASLTDGTLPYFGAAAAISPEAAAYKALAEVAQVCFWMPREAATNEMRTWSEWATPDNSLHLAPDGEALPGPPCEFSTREGLGLCVSRLETAGIEPFFVDLTRPEIGLPVVRTLAPGLRHCWARYAPGRLYSVPHSLGWLDRPLEESELNPTPCML